jgi:serine protease Do
VSTRATLLGVALLALAGPSRADDSFAQAVAEVNKKLVKLYGSGGYVGLASYGTGVIISPDGYILTLSSQMLNTPDLRVHMPDGQRLQAKVVIAEPELDVTLLKLTEKPDDPLPYFDLGQAAGKPLTEIGTGILAFSNQFNIASYDEPVSVQRGVIAAYGKLHGKKGAFEVPFNGDVYFIDAITNNPGAAGGVITTRKGELLGLIGKELKNSLTDTWVNYAVPVQAKMEIRNVEPPRTVSILELVEKKEQYRPVGAHNLEKGPGTNHGILLVPNVVDPTPPYVDEVRPGSAAAKGGLRVNDLIVYVDGEQVVSVKDFYDILDHAQPGTEMKLEVRRGDKLTNVVLKLEKAGDAKKKQP